MSSASEANHLGQADVQITAVVVTLDARFLSNNSERRNGGTGAIARPSTKICYFGTRLVAGVFGDRIMTGVNMSGAEMQYAFIMRTYQVKLSC